MDAYTRPIVPPAPVPHAAALPTWRRVYEFTRNTLAIWPQSSFEVLVEHGRSLGIESLLVNDPDGVRHVMVTAAARYRHPVPMARVLRPIVGNGLLLAEGAGWKQQRRQLAPVFNPASVETLLPHFLASGEAMIRGLSDAAPVQLLRVFDETALDAVLRALFSLPDDEARAPMAAMTRTYMSRHSGSIWDGLARAEADFAFASRGRRAFQRQWSGHVDSIIAKRRAAAASAPSRDLLSLLLAVRDPETGEPLTDADVRDQASTMLAAGFGTTARLLFWCGYLLCLDPSTQRRVRREIASFPPDRVAGLDDLNHWPLLRLVMLEALRLYPPAPHLIRQAVEEDTVLGETIGPGAQVWMSPWVIHRHHRFWDQPDAFIPERFAGQTSPWTNGPFMPFGAGPRICIGAAFALSEAQIILATLLSRFAISLADDRPVLPVGRLAISPDHEPDFVLERVAV